MEEFTDFEEIVYGFQGRRLDSETNGLMYFRNRYYNPQLGRFISRDPLQYVDSYGLYEAFGGNSYNYQDPYGEFRLTPTPEEVRNILVLIGITAEKSPSLHAKIAGRAMLFLAASSLLSGDTSTRERNLEIPPNTRSLPEIGEVHSNWHRDIQSIIGENIPIRRRSAVRQTRDVLREPYIRIISRAGEVAEHTVVHIRYKENGKYKNHVTHFTYLGAVKSTDQYAIRQIETIKANPHLGKLYKIRVTDAEAIRAHNIASEIENFNKTTQILYNTILGTKFKNSGLFGEGTTNCAQYARVIINRSSMIFGSFFKKPLTKRPGGPELRERLDKFYPLFTDDGIYPH